jgi:hypothetical protein
MLSPARYDCAGGRSFTIVGPERQPDDASAEAPGGRSGDRASRALAPQVRGTALSSAFPSLMTTLKSTALAWNLVIRSGICLSTLRFTAS